MDSYHAVAQIEISAERKSANDFPICDGKPCTLYIGKNDYEVVETVANLFAEDLERVTGKKPAVKKVSGRVTGKKEVMILRTVGHSTIIDAHVKCGKLDVSPIANGWEQYVVTVVDNSFSGVERALVVAGCDRRGTTCGTLALSEAMGVSPFYWWADVPVIKKKKNCICTLSTMPQNRRR